MKFELIYTKRAFKDIQNLDQHVKLRLKKSLELFSVSPFDHAEKLTNHSIGSYRFRVRDYRIIFDVGDERIIILHVGHRKEIYRKK